MSNEREVEEIPVGTHTVLFEPPDLFVVRLVGDFNLSDMLGTAEAYKRATGKFYLILDTTHLGSFSSEAKRVVSKVPLAAAVAIFGASRQAQLILSLLSKVYMMVNMGKAVDIKFMGSEAEGRAWLNQVRQRG